MLRNTLTALLLTMLAIPTIALANDPLAEEKQRSAEYLTKMATETGASVIDDGVVIRPIFEAPNGVFPKISDTVQVAYHLTDREGKLIEESLTSDELAAFPLAKLIKCWQIAIPKMSVGSLYKISCPSDTAYGDKGAGNDIKPGAALTFRVTLFGMEN